MKIFVSLGLASVMVGCVVVPETDSSYKYKCEISEDRQTLKVVDLAKDSNSYYSIGGLVLYPLTGVVSGTYVAVKNVYNLGKEKIVCD